MPVRSHIFAFTPATVSLASTSRFKDEYVESKTSMLIAVAAWERHVSQVTKANRHVWLAIPRQRIFSAMQEPCPRFDMCLSFWVRRCDCHAN